MVLLEPIPIRVEVLFLLFAEEISRIAIQDLESHSGDLEKHLLRCLEGR